MNIEKLAKELEIIGDDNAKWEDVAKHVAIMILDARLEAYHSSMGYDEYLDKKIDIYIAQLTLEKEELTKGD